MIAPSQIRVIVACHMRAARLLLFRATIEEFLEISPINAAGTIPK